MVKKELLVLVLMSALITTSASALGGVELRPGVVVDPATGMLFAMTPEGIDALDTSSGASKWQSQDATKPLGLVGGQLITQVDAERPGQLRLAVVDVSNGRLSRSTTVDLPGEVFAKVQASASTDFTARFDTDAAGPLIRWQFDWHRARGMPFMEDRQPLDAADAKVGEQMEKRLAAQSGQKSGAFRFEPSTGASVALEDIPAVETAAILLEGAQRIPDVEGRQFRSVDGQYVLVSERVADGREWNRYSWRIFSKATGERLGELRAPVSYSPFTVVGSTVGGSTLIYSTPPNQRRIDDEFVAEPLTLRGVSLSNGVEQWTRALRDTEYRGPLPP